MKRFKATGLGLLLALALASIAAAGPASAAEIRADEYPTSVSGVQTSQQVFKLAKANLTCDKLTTSGSLSGPSSSLNVTPAYSSCKLAGTAALISVKSCGLVMGVSGSFAINCTTGGDFIEAKTALCKLTIPAQSGLSGVSHSNVPLKSSGNRRINTNLNVSGLEYTETGVACPSAGTHKDGTYTGSTQTLASNSGAEHYVGLYLADEQETIRPEFYAENMPTSVKTQPTAGETAAGLTLPKAGTQASVYCASGMNVANNVWSTFTSEITQTVSSWTGCSPGTEIKMNSCAFNVIAETSEPYPFAGPETIAGDGKVDIVCSIPGDAITHTFGCKVEVPAQTGLNGVHFENMGSGSSHTLRADVALKGLKYTVTSAACGGTKGTHTDGTLYAHWTLSAVGSGVYLSE